MYNRIGGPVPRALDDWHVIDEDSPLVQDRFALVLILASFLILGPAVACHGEHESEAVRHQFSDVHPPGEGIRYFDDRDDHDRDDDRDHDDRDDDRDDYWDDDGDDRDDDRDHRDRDDDD